MQRNENESAINSHPIGIDTVKTFMFMEAERFWSIGIKERAGIGFFGFILPTDNGGIFRLRFRSTLNIYEKGDNNLFKNIAFTPFLGLSRETGLFQKVTRTHHEHSAAFYYHSNYCGFSVGTRKFENGKYSFEVFTSPLYLLTVYRTRATFTYHGSTVVFIDFLTQSIEIPLGFRYISDKRVTRFSIKSGISLNLMFADKELYNNSGCFSFNEIEGNYHFQSSHFSAFAEMGFHFGAKRYNQEKRKQRELLNI
jgi:hypothetical protein